MQIESQNKEEALEEEFGRVVEQINKQNQDLGFALSFLLCILSP